MRHPLYAIFAIVAYGLCGEPAHPELVEWVELFGNLATYHSPFNKPKTSSPSLENHEFLKRSKTKVNFACLSLQREYNFYDNRR
jgi:hypothetical protein